MNTTHHNKQNTTVCVGLSGGVDSAVTALLLKQQGYQVIGIYMQNWQADQDDPHCTAEQDLSDARAVADHIGIPFHTVNFAKQYWNNVFQHCLDEFSAGRTPNPDIWCNKEIKFSALLDHVKKLGADLLATGHYAKISQRDGFYQLCKAHDQNKDQTYFLHTLGQRELAQSLFPLSDYTKPQIRDIAKQAGLLNCNKKDSTGICFIGERKFKEFLQDFILAKPGVMKTPDGDTIGKHDGLMFYTIGQRKGLNIGGRKDSNDDPWYVIDKDITNNELIIGQGHNHPLLFKQTLTCEQVHWVQRQAPQLPLDCSAKTRYRQQDQACHVRQLDDDLLEVTFQQPQRAITPGQSVVFYLDDVCLGGAVIK